MNKKLDIYKLGRLLMILLAAVFLLSACSNSSIQATSPAEAQSAEELQSAGESCWQGKVLKTIYNTIGILIMSQFEKLTAGSMSVMMIAFAVWMAIRLLKFVSSVREDSPAQIWNEIIKKAFICVFCGSLAYSSGTLLYVINTLLFPIYAAFLDFGSQILALTPNVIREVTVFGHKIDFLSNDGMQLSCAITGNVTADLTGFPSAFSDSMNCMICQVVDRMRMGRGIALISMSMHGALPFFTGLLLWVIFYVVGFGFVFYLVDSVFRFGMMILMLPIFIMAYAFGPTKKWTKIGFENIMNSAAFMMAFSIIIATVLIALTDLIDKNSNIFNPANPQLHTQNLSVATLCLLLIGFLVFGSMGVSQQLTSSIIGGKTDAKFQQNLKATAQAVLGVITGGLGWVAKKAAFSEKTKVGRLLKRAGALRGKLDRLAGRNQ
ncbi:MAG: hypothetical protein E7010_04915 [Alphaproteobacteria bacterium]|nr:hypothetical protein [Alphaproteobacteria bacterium]